METKYIHANVETEIKLLMNKYSCDLVLSQDDMGVSLQVVSDGLFTTILSFSEEDVYLPPLVKLCDRIPHEKPQS